MGVVSKKDAGERKTPSSAALKRFKPVIKLASLYQRSEVKKRPTVSDGLPTQMQR